MEIYQDYGNDLVLTPQGDLTPASGVTLANQRIIRRLLTNPGDYIWHPEYGGGLGRYIGMTMTDQLLDEISAVITEQMYMEQAVSQVPPPTIELFPSFNRLDCTIVYTNKITNSQAVINFSAP